MVPAVPAEARPHASPIHPSSASRKPPRSTERHCRPVRLNPPRQTPTGGDRPTNDRTSSGRLAHELQVETPWATPTSAAVGGARHGVTPLNVPSIAGYRTDSPQGLLLEGVRGDHARTAIRKDRRLGSGGRARHHADPRFRLRAAPWRLLGPSTPEEFGDFTTRACTRHRPHRRTSSSRVTRRRPWTGTRRGLRRALQLRHPATFRLERQRAPARDEKAGEPKAHPRG